MKIFGSGIVQIGLHRQAEFIHYVGGEKNNNSKELDIGSCDYFLGVDYDPASISYMLNQYGHLEKAYFLCIGVGYEKTSEGLSWSGNKEKFLYKNIHLHTLFKETEIEHVELLALDIEGGEYDTFKYYDWSLLPKKIAVEAHSFTKPLEEGVSEIQETLSKQGYILEKSTPTNVNQKCPTMEMEFNLNER